LIVTAAGNELIGDKIADQCFESRAELAKRIKTQTKTEE
jgi:hypothetical protein